MEGVHTWQQDYKQACYILNLPLFTEFFCLTISSAGLAAITHTCAFTPSKHSLQVTELAAFQPTGHWLFSRLPTDTKCLQSHFTERQRATFLNLPVHRRNDNKAQEKVHQSTRKTEKEQTLSINGYCNICVPLTFTSLGKDCQQGS